MKILIYFTGKLFPQADEQDDLDDLQEQLETDSLDSVNRDFYHCAIQNRAMDIDQEAAGAVVDDEAEEAEQDEQEEEEEEGEEFDFGSRQFLPISISEPFLSPSQTFTHRFPTPSRSTQPVTLPLSKPTDSARHTDDRGDQISVPPDSDSDDSYSVPFIDVDLLNSLFCSVPDSPNNMFTSLPDIHSTNIPPSPTSDGKPEGPNTTGFEEFDSQPWDLELDMDDGMEMDQGMEMVIDGGDRVHGLEMVGLDSAVHTGTKRPRHFSSSPEHKRTRTDDQKRTTAITYRSRYAQGRKGEEFQQGSSRDISRLAPRRSPPLRPSSPLLMDEKIKRLSKFARINMVTGSLDEGAMPKSRKSLGKRRDPRT